MIQTETEAFWYLPENLTEAQQHGLASFREHLTSEKQLLKGHDDDRTLLRFLKARQWHVDKAVTMYTNMSKWRLEHEVDDLYEALDFPQLTTLMDHYPHFYHKTDKYGRPVYIELLGKIDCAKMLKVSNQEQIIDYHIWTWERLERVLMPSCSNLKGLPVITCTVVLDLQGMGMSSFTSTARQLLTAITHIDQDYYPEHLGTMFIINTPWVFTAMWKVVSPLLEERTRKKIIMLGADYLSTVTELIPIENLPTFLGGKSECSDQFNSHGPWNKVEPCKSFRWFPFGPKQALSPCSTASSSLSTIASSVTLDPPISGLSISSSP